MSRFSRLAGVLIAPIFVDAGMTSLRNAERLVPRAEPITARVTDAVPALPKDTRSLIRINGAAQVASGVLLALGKFRRLAALILIGSLIPTTLAGHPFWNEEDPGEQYGQRVQFWKNLAISGGLLLVLFEPVRKSKAKKDLQRASGDGGPDRRERYQA
jgi:putative oxidoreductase